MRQLITAAALLLATLAAEALPANIEHVETFRGLSQYRLKSNGMTFLLSQDRSSPVITFMVVYHVGSRNEAPGNTGSAHLLEHMIFNKSTQNFGRANGHKTFQEVLYEAGADAGSSNMTTWYDRMNGYSTLPSDKLELAMKIEADRLGRGLILDSERKSEMSVVRNEFEIGENNPVQALFKAVNAAAVQAHPYHWSTIGYRSDIEGVTTEKLKEHYKTYFHPNNAQAILVGDFDVEAALAMFDREFGAFKRSAHEIPKVITVEPAQEGERRVIVKRPGAVNLLMMAFMRPGSMHPDFLPLEVLSNILTDGVNSRLHQALVEKLLATDVGAFNFLLQDPYPIIFNATLAPGKGHAEAEAVVKQVIADIVARGVTEAEVKRAQRQIEVATIRARDGTYNFTSTLGEAIASSHWKRFLTYVDDVKAVSAADIKRVAEKYLGPDQATVGWFIPTASVKKVDMAAPAAAPLAAPEAPSAPAASAQATARSTFAQRTVRKVLANGLIVDVMENRAVPTVAVRGIVFAGDTSAPAGKRAMPALAAKMLARGTTARTKEQIGAILDDVGATRTYAAGLTESSISANGMARDLPMLLEIVAEEIARPAFGADEVEKARKELENDYLRADDSTSLRAMERLAQLVFAKEHPYYGFSREEKLASLKAVTEADLRDFHRSRYVGAGMILAIAGDVDAARTIALVEKLFGDLPRGQRLRWTSMPRVAPSATAVREAVTMRGKANMNLIFGTASGLRRSDPDYEAALVANAALGQTALSSRLGKRVRDTEGLTYQIFSRYFNSEELDGLWAANVNVAPQNLAKAMKSTREVIDQFAREGVNDTEVEAQKSFFAGNYQVNLGSNAGITAALVTAEKFGYGPRYLDEYPARIRAVTTAQANAALRKYFHAGKLNVIVAGDLEKLPE